ncbi:uncharacterized protein LOC119564796 isoform X4 [Chelonia mydas]|uniref:uncharacterized protein LOC119564796 isoform X4 n=1 Tax=Chelonia mydas TaxID=8469 RepID=UPI001CA7F4A8|nr:uncharacterized protein LOC119564796 isoform X4 [Chelonia mydas]
MGCGVSSKPLDRQALQAEGAACCAGGANSVHAASALLLERLSTCKETNPAPFSHDPEMHRLHSPAVPGCHHGSRTKKPKMNVVHALRSERRAGPGVEAMERPNLRAVDQLSPEIKVEKYVLLSLDGKLLGPELSRIRSEMALPLERLDVELPQDLPKGYLSRQRRSLPAFPFSPAKSPCSSPGLRSPRRSTEALCAGHFPLGLSQLVTGMQSPGVASPRGARNPSAQPSVIPAKVTGSKTKAGEGLCHSHGPRMQPESDRKQQQTLGGKGAC